MAKRILKLIGRHGRKVTVSDESGRTHHAVLGKPDKASAVREEGSFAFGYCKSCDWTGPGRRARSKAVQDATSHEPDCPGQGKVRVAVAEH